MLPPRCAIRSSWLRSTKTEPTLLRSLSRLTPLVLGLLVVLLTNPATATGSPMGAHAPAPIAGVRPAGAGTLMMNVTAGTTGTPVTLSGSTGILANTTVAIDAAGVPIDTVCRADPTGTFPGLTATPCTVRIPLEPAGPAPLQGYAWLTNQSVTVGRDPEASGYDPSTGQIFVGNYYSGNVTIIAGGNGTVVGAVGNFSGCASGFAYDSAREAMIIANYCTDSVDLLSSTNDSVIQSVTVGTYPYGICFDNATDAAFVSNGGSGTISEIANSTFTVNSTIDVTGQPEGLACASDLNEIYVANGQSFWNNVTVLRATNGSEVADIGVGSYPYALSYDPVRQQVFVANDGASANVSVISALSNSVVATIATGTNPSAMAFDPQLNETFVACSGTDNVTVISDATDSAVFSLSAGTSPDAATYDARAGSVWVAGGNYSYGNETVLEEADNGSPFASSSFDVQPSAVLDRVSAFPGATITATGTGFAANSTITISYAGIATPAVCGTNSTGSFPGTFGTACAFVVPSSPGGPVSVTVSDGTNSLTLAFFVPEGMTLAPTPASAGEAITASGVGPIAGAGLDFTVGNESVATNCTSGSGGAFPGSPLSPCTFDLPAMPQGTYTVTADNWTNYTIPGAGPAPYGVAYDSGTGQVFVSDSGSDLVTVVNATTDIPVRTIAVGTDPMGIAYDAAQGEIFVADEYSNCSSEPCGPGTVNVISDATDQIVTNITVGSNPDAVVYAPSQGEVFVVNVNCTFFLFGPCPNATLSVIDAVNDSVLSTVGIGVPGGVGNWPEGAAYDPQADELFVASLLANDVTVIDTENNSVVGSIPTIYFPYAVAYDSALDELFVTGAVFGGVQVIDLANESQVAFIQVGSGPDGLLYLPDTGAMLVANAYTNNVSIVSDLTNSVVATVSVGDFPQGIVDDPQTGEVFVADDYQNALSAIYPMEFGYHDLAVETNLTLLSPLYGVDIGQVAVLNGSGFASSVNLTETALGNLTLFCTGAVIGACVDGNVSTNHYGSFEANFTIPADVATGINRFQFSDAEGDSANATVVVYSDPSVPTISASRTSLDVDQQITLSATVLYGSGGFTYTWAGLPPGCTSQNASFGCVPNQPGNYSITVTAADSDGYARTSSPLVFQVFPDPAASTPTPSRTSGTVDAGQTIAFQTVASGGTGLYSTFSWTGLPGGCTNLSGANVTCSGAGLRAGSYTISVSVTDSNGFESSAGRSIRFVVDADPALGVPTSNRTSVDVGQGLTLSDAALNGTGLHAYVWSGLPTGCSGDGTAVLSCVPSAAGTFDVTLQATDGNNATAVSGPLDLTVFADPTVQVVAPKAAFDVGQTLALAANATGGTGTFTYAWSGLPAGCPTSGVNVSCPLVKTGSLSIRLQATDSNDFAVTSAIVTLAIAPAIAAQIAASSTAAAGVAILFNATASGGTGSLGYAWEFGDGHSGTGASVDHAFATAGSYVVRLWVNDTVGGSVERNLTVTVASASSSSSTASTSWIWLAGVAVVVVLVALALVVLVILPRRRRGSANSKPTPPETPTPTAPPKGDRDVEAEFDDDAP
jgi:YVTN family beta-propeller protein